MKTVTVRLFAAFRDAAGIERATFSSEAVSLGELFREVAGRYPGLQHEPAALVAINDTMAQWDSPFDDGDEVLFFPPVAGG